MERASDDHNESRRGKITGSKMDVVVDGTPRAKNTYLDTLQSQIEGAEMPQLGAGGTGRAADWGVEHEDEAIAHYELSRDIDVDRPAFIVHPELPYLGCSPDFLSPVVVGEVKCPYDSDVHQLTVLYGQGPETYKGQIQTEIEVSVRDSCDFISYDPRHPDHNLRLVVIPVHRDEAYIDDMLEKCFLFHQKLVSGERYQVGVGDTIPSLF